MGHQKLKTFNAAVSPLLWFKVDIFVITKLSKIVARHVSWLL